MKRWLGGTTLALCGAMALWAADDTDAAKKTRDEALMVKVTVTWKEIPLKDVLGELVSKIDDAGKGKLEIKYATGVSMNTKVSFAGKDKTVEEVLDGLLKADMGYLVISKKGDKADGGLMITKGTERGTAMAGKPGDKPKDKPKDTTKPEPKDKPEPKTKPAPKPPDPKEPPSEDAKEKQAQSKLDLIKALIDNNKKDKAKERLEELIKAFPDTKAVIEAKELLEKLK